MSSSSRDSGDSPAVRLGRQLKRIRLAAGYTSHPALAARIGWGEDVIQKGETGKRVPSGEVFRAILNACTTSADGTRQVLTDGERQALTELWEIARAASGPIPEFIERWFENEARAAFLRLWGLLFMPGQLQTREYARAMFLAGGYDEDEAAEKVDVRVGRQAIFNPPDPAHVTAVIHELALYFRVGTPQVMIGQLARLLELSRRRNAVIQVVRDSGYFSGVVGPFELVSGEAIPDTLLMLTVEDQTMEDTALTRKAIALFEEIRGFALSVEDSRAVILEAIEVWKSRQQ
jgi:transcriptional regulator with XRE-family HTH domain